MAGFVFHVINRGSRRGLLFEKPGHYDAFEAILREALRLCPIRRLVFCAMPNHFHLVCWPETDDQLPEFMHRFTGTHALRWRVTTKTVGQGAVYQGRYKAIPVQTERYFLALARYVERNPLRARLVAKSEDWRWSSLWHREVARDKFPLATWPVAPPTEWIETVNRPQSAAELSAIRLSMIRGCALGNDSWREEVGKCLGIPGYFRPRGRPRANDS